VLIGYLLVETIQKLRPRVEPVSVLLDSHLRYLLLGLALAVGCGGALFRADDTALERLGLAVGCIIGVVVVAAGSRDLARWLKVNSTTDGSDLGSVDGTGAEKTTVATRPVTADHLAVGIEIRLLPAERDGREHPIGRVGESYVARQYRPDWRLPKMTPPEMSGAPVLCLEKYPLTPGVESRAVIVPLAPAMVPRWKQLCEGDALSPKSSTNATRRRRE
jgi:hypothetical protein